MRRKDREVTDRSKIVETISFCDCCRLGFSTPDGVYIVPLNFGFVAGTPDVFYFHGAKQGRKAELLAERPQVGFELDCSHTLLEGAEACKYSFLYRSVIGTGTAEIVADPDEQVRAMQALMAHYAPERTFSFSAEQLAGVLIFRVTIAQMTCKEHL